MLSEDGNNQKVWSVLQKIKRNYILKNYESPIQYEINLFPTNNNSISSQEECEILKELTVLKVIRIYRRKLKNSFCILVSLDIIQPKFSEIYKQLEKHQKMLIFQSKQKNNESKSNLFNNQNNKNLCFPTYYLKQEIKRFDILLRHFLKAGIICHKDYRYLLIINKIIRKTITEVVINENKENKNNFPKNCQRYNKEKRIKHQNFKTKVTINRGNKEQKTQIERKPIPITGKIEVSGLSEGLKALRTKEPIITGPKFPFKIPAGTHWNNVIIKFLNEEEIEIHVKKLKHITNYKELGMIGKGKVPTPNEQWIFLKVLAQCQGEITIKDPEAKDKYKKQKQALTETLRKYFSIDYDPFYPYKSCMEKDGNSYKIKILLIPPQQKESIQNIIEEETDPFGIQEFLSTTMVEK
jgi:hypothetical protein